MFLATALVFSAAETLLLADQIDAAYQMSQQTNRRPPNSALYAKGARRDRAQTREADVHNEKLLLVDWPVYVILGIVSVFGFLGSFWGRAGTLHLLTLFNFLTPGNKALQLVSYNQVSPSPLCFVPFK